MLKHLHSVWASLIRKQNVKLAYQRVLTSDDGKAMLKDLIRMHCCTPTFTENADVLRFKEGKRAIVLQLVHTAFSKDETASEIMRVVEEIEAENQNPQES